jgi:hypothetical protein
VSGSRRAPSWGPVGEGGVLRHCRLGWAGSPAARALLPLAPGEALLASRRRNCVLGGDVGELLHALGDVLGGVPDPLRAAPEVAPGSLYLPLRLDAVAVHDARRLHAPLAQLARQPRAGRAGCGVPVGIRSTAEGEPIVLRTATDGAGGPPLKLLRDLGQPPPGLQPAESPWLILVVELVCLDDVRPMHGDGGSRRWRGERPARVACRARLQLAHTCAPQAHHLRAYRRRAGWDRGAVRDGPVAAPSAVTAPRIAISAAPAKGAHAESTPRPADRAACGLSAPGRSPLAGDARSSERSSPCRACAARPAAVRLPPPEQRRAADRLGWRRPPHSSARSANSIAAPKGSPVDQDHLVLVGGRRDPRVELRIDHPELAAVTDRGGGHLEQVARDDLLDYA